MKYLLVALAFFLSLTFVWADQVEVRVEEDLLQTELFNGNYSILANGFLSIYNPSSTDTVYEFSFDYEIGDPLVSIGKQNQFYNATMFDITDERVKGYLIEPGANITLPYVIYGITNRNLVARLTGDTDTLFELYTNSSSYEFVPRPVVALNKLERVNESEVISPRTVISEVNNPSSFDLTLRNMSVYKTDVSDPFFSNGTIIDSRQGVDISPNSYTEYEFEDNQSYNNSVYWLSLDLVIDYSFNSEISFSLATETEASSGGGGGGGSGLTFNITTLPVEYSFAVKKNANSSIVEDGEEVLITLTVVNNNNESAEDVVLSDVVLTNLYDIVDNGGGTLGLDGVLSFEVGDIDAYSSKDVSYSIVNKEKINGSVDLPQAQVIYEEQLFLSNELTLIHDLLADKRIFIEKEIIPVDDRFSQVKITVRNLGSISVEDILVSDIIGNETVVRQLSQNFHEETRGIWSIPILEPGDEWIITYLVENDAEDLETLPTLYGVEKQDVFGILLTPKEIILSFSEDSTLRIERIGLGLAVGFVLFYLFF